MRRSGLFWERFVWVWGGRAAGGGGGVFALVSPLLFPAGGGFLTLTWERMVPPSLAKGWFPPVWSPWKCVLMRYLIGLFEIASMTALILSCSGAYWPSTIMMPSFPTATVIFPP